ncbi:3-isopropylmalate dehydratase [Helicobacter saguini]|uniref:3-isopropylmalate dehydratase small subunit n=2 Tax=Helicobacter saguini TaxID=1548018 RepID=A0A347VTM6_9HELI|nr:3-isopropylmalate dehydratase [Helicobacter saguini]MWV67291.1 3-isopropylmalate dehydratase [Helicobacter saguini]MWV69644.1 3-isopropylmalate dehydratase [Helicobacter saguini]MWV70805.1 3-isopropylmalate dehydratase [Helicobacter saguini]TLD94354.1 3-isopropylmalate dehydratase small subunit [Helicobacter saguini]
MMGKAWKFGDNIDTDLIIAARYLNTSDGKELAKKVFEDARAGLASEIQKGDIIVAGENFGCGSSREHAPLAIREAGVAAVLAPYFARIFYRNAFNTGLLILELEPRDITSINEGDELEIDLDSKCVINKTQNTQYSFKEIPPFMQELLKSGGLMAYAKAKL